MCLCIVCAFAKLQADLTPAEQTHIADCEECRLELQTCLQAQNFGSVLRELKGKK
jgi:hypothetical protein